MNNPEAVNPAEQGAPAYDADVLDRVLGEWQERAIQPYEKGFTDLGPITPARLVGDGHTLAELSPPVMTLRETALAHNVATMARWTTERGVRHAPHGKTTMSPEIVARQLRAGVWAITAATIGEVRTFVDLGVRRVVLANQLVDPAGIRWLARAMRELPDLTVIGYVDSTDGVALLDRELTAASASRPLPVLVELGVAGKRTGARGPEAALEVARAASSSAALEVVGASAFEGVLGHDRDQATFDAVAELCRSVREIGLRVADQPIVSAGGSTFFDVVAEALSGPEPATVVIRSGGYVTHDDGLYSHATPLPSDRPDGLTPAIEVHAQVLSRPEPTRALVGAGRRDLPFDVRLPMVTSLSEVDVSSLNDQHAFLDVPADLSLTTGDRVVFGIAHPCTAFDKWRVVPVIDDRERIVQVAHTLF